MRNGIFKQGIIVCCLALVLNGCSSRPDQGQSAGMGTQGSASEDDTAVITHLEVEIKDMKFQPAEIFAKNGDTITFINNDLVAHDVTEEKNKEWSSSTLSPGESWSMMVTKSAAYYCSIHQVMKGKITLQ